MMVTNSLFSKINFKKACLGILCSIVAFVPIAQVRADRLKIISFGHSSLLIKGGGHSVLLNPFKAVGCAEGLEEPKVHADIVLASSELADEGNRDVKGVFMVTPGSYRVRGLSIEGIQAPHDRFNGRRYGFATAWQWVQGGVNFVHLGGSTTPLEFQDKLLMGRPDVLFIAVGGGSKVYSGREAASVVKFLNPKVVIPVQYIRGTTPKSCDLTGIQPFLDEMQGFEVKEVGRKLTVKANMTDELTINLMP